jgi:hypothetical protein
MKIELLKFKKEEEEIVSEKKEYEIPFVPAGAFLEWLEVEEDIEDIDRLKSSEIKRIASLIVKTYENQFTEEEFFKGVPGHRLMETFALFIASLNTDPYANKKQKETESDGGNSEKKVV